jgi:hypothetical protein
MTLIRAAVLPLLVMFAAPSYAPQHQPAPPPATKVPTLRKLTSRP